MAILSKNRWSNSELSILRSNYLQYKTADAFRIDHLPLRSLYSIQKKAKREGIFRASQWEVIGNYDHLTKEQICYFAGIIDGEGYIRSNGYYVIQVVNTSKILIDWLTENIGGTVTSIRIPENKKHKPQWTWSIQRREKVVKLLSILLPYLTVKHEKANKIIMEVNKHE